MFSSFLLVCRLFFGSVRVLQLSLDVNEAAALESSRVLVEAGVSGGVNRRNCVNIGLAGCCGQTQVL